MTLSLLPLATTLATILRWRPTTLVRFLWTGSGAGKRLYSVVPLSLLLLFLRCDDRVDNVTDCFEFCRWRVRWHGVQHATVLGPPTRSGQSSRTSADGPSGRRGGPCKEHRTNGEGVVLLVQPEIGEGSVGAKIIKCSKVIFYPYIGITPALAILTKKQVCLSCEKKQTNPVHNYRLLWQRPNFRLRTASRSARSS